jgi:hypothetical protein
MGAAPIYRSGRPVSDISIDFDPSSATYRDMVILDGDAVLTSDADPRGTHPVLQNIRQALGAFRGEWFMDTTVGVPWFQTIFQKGTSKAERDAVLSAAILGAPGVIQLASFSSTVDYATRSMAVSFAANTVNGTVATDFSVEYAGGVFPQ